MRKINFALLLVFLVVFNFIIVKEGYAANSTHHGPDAQAITVDVFNAGKESQTYVYWYQMDNGDFRADADFSGSKYAVPLGSYPNLYPVKTTVSIRLDYQNYIAAEKWSTLENKKFDANYVNNISFIGTSFKSDGITKFEMDGQNYIFMHTDTGGEPSSWDLPASCTLSNDLRPYPVDTFPYPSTNHKKVHCEYALRFQLEFKGVVTESKRLDTTITKSSLFVGEQTNANAGVSTRIHANASMSDPVDVTSNSQTTWKSTANAIATVDNNGKVKGVSPGTAQICANWTRAFDNTVDWDLDDCVTVTVVDSGGTVTSADLCYNPSQTNSTTLIIKIARDGQMIDVTNHAGTTVTIKSGGAYATLNGRTLTAKNAGTVTLEIVFQSTLGGDPIKLNYTVNINNCDTPGPPGGPPSGGGTCDFTISTGAIGGTMQSSFLNANPSGFISSETGQFDVVQGIPSSESLTTQATTPQYLFNQVYEKQTGKVSYTVTVTKNFILEWEEPAEPAPEGDPDAPPGPGADPDAPPPPPEKKTEEATEQIEVQIEHDFSYWNVSEFDVWTADRALITNYALPNSQSLMMVSDRVTADATKDMDVNNHVFPSECAPIELPPETINGGTSKPDIPDFEGEAKAAAEGEIQPPDVKNDKAIFNGSTLMNDSLTTGGHAPEPMNIPLPSNITVNNNNLLIEPTKTNYWQAPSTGMFAYQGIFGLNGTPSSKEFNFAVNTVTVHTPVVIYATATDDKEHDQRINPPLRSTPANPSVDRHAFILDRPFTVTLPTAGQHRNIPGYGNRDYAKYIKKKEVKFPFDVYTETKLGYYPANTWIEVPVNLNDVTFFMPVWVPEGQYVIEFRSHAINALNSGDFGGSEEKANITIPNGIYNVAPAGTLSAAHVAETSINVDVVGRLYDFQVTDIEDYNWKNVFRNTDMTASGNSYFVGLKGIDNDVRGNNSPYILPISHASNPNGIKNLAVKQGYSFSFNFKTKGDMQSAKDAIRITPRFYYVNKDGSGRQEVDLYYHDNSEKFIKIGSNDDQTYRTVSLNKTSRSVNTTEIANNAIHQFNYADRFDLTNVVSEHTQSSYARSYAKYYSKDEIETGPYSWQILNWKLRTYRGPQRNEVPTNTMIPTDEIVTKEQTWYGEYSLPANTYVVSKNTSINEVGRLGVLNDNHPIFLKDGYIIVNFDIETINEGDLANPYLSYHNAFYMSQWTDMEEFQPSFVDGYGKTFTNLEGDVIYYHAGQSSLDDFSASVTH